MHRIWWFRLCACLTRESALGAKQREKEFIGPGKTGIGVRSACGKRTPPWLGRKHFRQHFRHFACSGQAHHGANRAIRGILRRHIVPGMWRASLSNVFLLKRINMGSIFEGLNIGRRRTERLHMLANRTCYLNTPFHGCI